MVLVNITDVTENVQSEDVAIASTLLVRIADSTDVQDVDVSTHKQHLYIYNIIYIQGCSH